MFNTVISFGNDISVPEEVLEKTVEDILQTIKSELPEEAQTYEVYESILCRCKDRLQSGRIVLEHLFYHILERIRDDFQFFILGSGSAMNQIGICFDIENEGISICPLVGFIGNAYGNRFWIFKYFAWVYVTNEGLIWSNKSIFDVLKRNVFWAVGALS